jgi:hypothetical protein
MGKQSLESFYDKLEPTFSAILGRETLAIHGKIISSHSETISVTAFAFAPS